MATGLILKLGCEIMQFLLNKLNCLLRNNFILNVFCKIMSRYFSHLGSIIWLKSTPFNSAVLDYIWRSPVTLNEHRITGPSSCRCYCKSETSLTKPIYGGCSPSQWAEHFYTSAPCYS